MFLQIIPLIMIILEAEFYAPNMAEFAQRADICYQPEEFAMLPRNGKDKQ